MCMLRPRLRRDQRGAATRLKSHSGVGWGQRGASPGHPSPASQTQRREADRAPQSRGRQSRKVAEAPPRQSSQGSNGQDRPWRGGECRGPSSQALRRRGVAREDIPRSRPPPPSPGPTPCCPCQGPRNTELVLQRKEFVCSCASTEVSRGPAP